MRVFRFKAPYNSAGRTNFRDSFERSGVYLIKENDKIVYVGVSSRTHGKLGGNLYRTLYRHFQHWNHSGQEVVTYKGMMSRNKYSVRVIYCTPLQAERLERILILKYNPRDNTNKYQDYTTRTADQEILEKYTESIIEEVPF